jgi:hypothetical protein
MVPAAPIAAARRQFLVNFVERNRLLSVDRPAKKCATRSSR